MSIAVRRRSLGRSSGGCMARILVALVVAAIAIGGYFLGTRRVENPITGEVQRVSLTPQQEVALGLQAAPEMARQHGGLHPDDRAQALVDQIGDELVHATSAADSPYDFEFHVLSDSRTVNALALPGGQIFITAALLERLDTRAELAGVLAHEIGHVVARHASERIAKTQLTEGLADAAIIAVTEPNAPESARAAQVAKLVSAMVNMKYSRSDELESDRLGVRFMAEAGYDPRALLEVMRVLEQAGGGQGQPEFMSTHPAPRNRLAQIQAAIEDVFPEGVPPNLEQ